MTSVIDVSKERVWDGLIDGFEKYLAVLTERAALIQETDALDQQVGCALNCFDLHNSLNTLFDDY